jgi:tetratricopeptide (TPR) repeat protein
MFRKSLHVLLLSVALTLRAGAATEQWVEVRSPHFTVVTDSNEKQARHILDQFERMRWVFQTLFPKLNVDPPAPILVFAAKNTKTFQSFEPAAYLAKGQLNLAGYFLSTPDKNYVLLRLDAEQENPYATIYHEYTHLQFRSGADWMPLWLNEGLAEFMQNTEIHNKDVELGKPSRDDILYLRQTSLIPLPVLLKVDATSPYYHEEQKGSVFYAEAWALTHYLEVSDKEKGTHRLADYLTLMSHHADSVEAAAKAFGDLKDLQAALQSYIRDSSYKQFILNSSAAPIDESTYTARNLSPFEAEAARADVLASVQREKEARALIEEILKSDPNNVAARETMGSIELRANNHEAARKWYGEAVKLDSKSYLANYYFAVISIEIGGSGQEESIELSLRSAISLNPQFAPAYDRLANYLSMRHKNLEEAQSLSDKAVHLDPGNVYFRTNAASVLTVMARYADANSMLRSALAVCRNPSQSSMVQNQLTQLHQFQRRIEETEKEQRIVDHLNAQDNVGVVDVVLPADDKPKHPDEAKGPKHSATGVIHQVSCGNSASIEFKLDGGKKPLTVYSNDFTKIDLSAFGMAPNSTINPCKDFEGRKARIQYAEAADSSVDGKVIAVELRQ